MLYELARPLLFSLDPETAHRVTLWSADLLGGVGVLGLLTSRGGFCPVRAMGFLFPNPVGLAAGLDKNADHIDTLATLGFGFIEVGTVTPRPQPGNPRPRLFRLPRANALINRFGFNNVGLDAFRANLSRARYRGILGINIGKNFDTPIERAADDYCLCLEGVYEYASYVTINVSSPNTRGLRALQASTELDALLGRICTVRDRLARVTSRRVPLALKIAPDLEDSQIHDVAAAVAEHALDAVIATNTSLSREGVEGMQHGQEAGGLSGAPIRNRANGVLAKLVRETGGSVPLIGAGGILTGEDAAGKIRAGASLVQLYTGLIYRGPGLIAECVGAIAAEPATTNA
ncbi:MAG: quinone-dependent dihydroorotate dehydrogenase [Betaproteobacteria bacterium]|nr:quinone-dependent dihydroorotate dehydrogenase [Betaproteobacteria bacterium]